MNPSKRTTEQYEMTGKKWFYWLGKLHGSRKVSKNSKEYKKWPMFAQNAYALGFWDGFNEVSK